MRKLPYTYRNRKRLADGRVKEYWRFRRDGTDCPLPGDPRTDTAAMRAYADLADRADRLAQEHAEPDRHTFEWLATAYLRSAEFKALADITQRDYRRTITAHLVPIMGPERFDCMTRQAVKQVRDHVAKTQAPRTANKVKQVTSLIYSWADQEELVPGGFNPASGLKKLKGRRRVIEVWSDEEVALFLSHATVREQTIVMLALYTGQRCEDLAQMEWSDCLGDMIRVRQNKTGEPLVLPCHAELKRHLAAVRNSFGGPVIRGEKGRPMNSNSITSAITRAVGRIDAMPKRSMHGLRYAACGILEELGCTQLQITAITGHNTYEMFKKYASQRRDAKAAVDRWELGNKA